MQRIAGEDVSFVFTCEVAGKLPEGAAAPGAPVPRPAPAPLVRQRRMCEESLTMGGARGADLGLENSAPPASGTESAGAGGKRQLETSSRGSEGNGLKAPLREIQASAIGHPRGAIRPAEDAPPGEESDSLRPKLGRGPASAPLPSEIEIMVLSSDSDDY